MLAREEHTLPIVPPREHANLVGEPRDIPVLGIVVKVAEEEARGRLHAFVLELPEADLVDDGGREDRLALGGGLPVHLLVGVGGEVGDDLVGCDAKVNGLADGLASQTTGHHAWELDGEVAEEREDGDLQLRRCVRVDPVVGLDDDAVGLVAWSALGL
ncbi:hypothetical protein HYQ46_002944 [Verticillium longisporum]|nr:hypothetical protein HYQ46_002944 [Verticillium longisporum]